jgi:type II secretory pathway pseudopilin PulG
MRHRQKGMTFIGLVCVMVLVGAIAYAGILLVPVYLNYMKVVSSMESVAAEFKSDNPDQARMRIALDKRWTIEGLTVIDVTQVEIKKDNDVVVMHVAYDDKVPYIANVALLVSFDKTVKVQ